MSQPIWKTLQSLGDRGLIFEDVTGVYPPEAEVWEEYEKEDDGEVELDDDGEEVSRNRTYVYRFSLDRCDMLPSGALVPHGFVARDDLPFGIDHYEEWFSNHLSDVARSVGQTREEIAAAFCSADPCERFWAYEAVAGYHGLHNFDDYPLDLSEKEMEEREDMHRENDKAAREYEKQQAKRAISRYMVTPHAKCQKANRCVEHDYDSDIPACEFQHGRCAEAGRCVVNEEDPDEMPCGEAQMKFDWKGRYRP